MFEAIQGKRFSALLTRLSKLDDIILVMAVVIVLLCFGVVAKMSAFLTLYRFAQITRQLVIFLVVPTGESPDCIMNIKTRHLNQAGGFF